eukprot:NODE_362_length_10118_cov_0.149117.p1 type:complete len:1232 gc:universal NODE_362_length_10118_cov_0.149117:5436-1741(-)
MDKKLKEAAAALKSKNFSRAYEVTESILMFNAMNYKALLIHGQSLVGLNKLDAAEDAFKRAIENDSNPMMAYYGLSQVYKQLKQHRKQLELLTKILDSQEYFQGAVEALKCCQRLKDYKLGCKLANKVLQEYKLSSKQERQIYSLLYYIQKDMGSVDIPVYLKLLSFKEPLHSEAFDQILSRFKGYSDKSYYFSILKKLTIDADLSKGREFFAQFDTDMFAFNPLELNADELLNFCASFNPPISFIQTIIKSFAKLFRNPEDLDLLNEFISGSESFISGSHPILQLFILFVLFTFEQYDSIIEYTKTVLDSLSSLSSIYPVDLSLFFSFVINILVGSCCYATFNNSVYDLIVSNASYISDDYLILIKLKYFLDHEINDDLESIKNQVARIDYKEYSIVSAQLQSRYYILVNQYSDAMALLKPLISADELLLLYCKCLFHLEDYDQLHGLLIPYINNNEHPYALLYLGYYYQFHSNIPTKAFKCFMKSISIEYTADAGSSLCLLLLNNKSLCLANTSSVVPVLQTIQPPTSQSLYLLSMIYYSHKDYNLCITSCNMYICLDSSNLVISEFLASSWYSVGNYKSSLSAYRSIKAAIANDSAAINVYYYMQYKIVECMHHLKLYPLVFGELETLMGSKLYTKSIKSLKYIVYYNYIQYLLSNTMIKSAISVCTSLMSSVEDLMDLKGTVMCLTLLIPWSDIHGIEMKELLAKISKIDSSASITGSSTLELILKLVVKYDKNNTTIAMLHLRGINASELDSSELDRITDANLLGYYNYSIRNLQLAQHYCITDIIVNNNAHGYYMLSYVYSSDLELSIECILKARDLEPNNMLYWTRLVELHHGISSNASIHLKNANTLLYVLLKEFRLDAMELLIDILYRMTDYGGLDADKLIMVLRQYASIQQIGYKCQSVMERLDVSVRPVIDATTDIKASTSASGLMIQAIQNLNNKDGLQFIQKLLRIVDCTNRDVITSICKLLCHMGHFKDAYKVINQKSANPELVDKVGYLNGYYNSDLHRYYNSGDVKYLYKMMMLNPIENENEYLRSLNRLNYQRDLVNGSKMIKRNRHSKEYISRYDALKWKYMMPTEKDGVMNKLNKMDNAQQISELMNIISNGNGYWRVYTRLYKILIKCGYKKTSLIIVKELPLIWQMWDAIFIRDNKSRGLELLNILDIDNKEEIRAYLNDEMNKDLTTSVFGKIAYFMKLYGKDEQKAKDYIKSVKPRHERIDLIIENFE